MKKRTSKIKTTHGFGLRKTPAKGKNWYVLMLSNNRAVLALGKPGEDFEVDTLNQDECRRLAGALLTAATGGLKPTGKAGATVKLTLQYNVKQAKAKVKR